MRIKNGALALVFLLCLLWTTGCWKEEYSYEGGEIELVDTTAIPQLPQNTLPVVTCIKCLPDVTAAADEWHFAYNKSALCGPITNAVLSPEKTAVTFFGPSACSIDTGLIITGFLDTPLDTTRTQVQVSHPTFRYYNKNAAADVFQSNSNVPFTVIIDTYDAQTRIATGRFSGAAFTASGKQVTIEAGTFNIHFK